MKQDEGTRLKLEKREKQAFKLFDAQVTSPQKQRTRTRPVMRVKRALKCELRGAGTVENIMNEQY